MIVLSTLAVLNVFDNIMCKKMLCNSTIYVFDIKTFQIYTGRYRNPREREAPEEMVDDDFLTSLEVGCFVALYFSNFEREPVIGKVISIEDNYFEVHYWKETYLGKWSLQHVPHRRVQPWVERLPKACIVCNSFQLTEDSRLMTLTRNFLKDQYNALKNSSS